jgi:hypothetical protein
VDAHATLTSRRDPSAWTVWHTPASRAWPAWPFRAALAGLWLGAIATPAFGTGPSILIQLTSAMLLVGIGSVDVIRRGRHVGMPRMERELRLARTQGDAGYRDADGWSVALDGRVLERARAQRAVVTRRPDGERRVVSWGLYLLLEGGGAIEITQGLDDEPAVRRVARELHRMLEDEAAETLEIDLGPIDWEGVSTTPLLVAGTSLAILVPVVGTSIASGVAAAWLVAATSTVGFILLRSLGIAMLGARRAQLAQQLHTGRVPR